MELDFQAIVQNDPRSPLAQFVLGLTAFRSGRYEASPAQGGKTMVACVAELMSPDLPAPPEASRVQYADATTELSFDVKRDPAELFAFYQRDWRTSAGS